MSLTRWPSLLSWWKNRVLVPGGRGWKGGRDGAAWEVEQVLLQHRCSLNQTRFQGVKQGEWGMGNGGIQGGLVLSSGKKLFLRFFYSWFYSKLFNLFCFIPSLYTYSPTIAAFPIFLLLSSFKSCLGKYLMKFSLLCFAYKEKIFQKWQRLHWLLSLDTSNQFSLFQKKSFFRNWIFVWTRTGCCRRAILSV